MQHPLPLADEGAPSRRRVAVAHGFSLHANTFVHGNDRLARKVSGRFNGTFNGRHISHVTSTKP
jgi:hypothetical protein